MLCSIKDKKEIEKSLPRPEGFFVLKKRLKILLKMQYNINNNNNNNAPPTAAAPLCTYRPATHAGLFYFLPKNVLKTF